MVMWTLNVLVTWIVQKVHLKHAYNKLHVFSYIYVGKINKHADADVPIVIQLNINFLHVALWKNKLVLMPMCRYLLNRMFISYILHHKKKWCQCRCADTYWTECSFWRFYTSKKNNANADVLILIEQNVHIEDFPL